MSLLWVGILGSIVFLFGIELETVFYFLPITKINVLFALAGICGIYLLFWFIQFFRSQHDLIDRYKIETLSLRLGQAAFPEKHV